MRARTSLRSVLAVVVALPLAACQGSPGGSLTGPSALSAPGGAGSARIENAPFEGRDSGTLELGVGSCVPGLAPLRTSTTGTGTLIGAYAFETQECFDLAALTFSGSFTITAANGDTLVGAYAGYLTGRDGPTSLYAFTATVTGGTGRFEQATGTFSGTGQGNLSTLEESRSFSGTITGTPRGPS
jgi:hypothetical protein